jgi:hypothetical protein
MEFERKIENKNDLAEAKTLNDQERHLALEMSTSETAHAGMEKENIHLQNNIKAKSKNKKLSKTDPST